MMVPKIVEQGLWGFHVENFPTGLALRNHPIDIGINNTLIQQVPQVVLKPMQKVYCDRKVTACNGVNFYRVQQGPSHRPAWIFDRRGSQSMLVSDSKVETGLFAFRILPEQEVAIRTQPDVGDDSKTTWTVRANETIVCDIVCESAWPELGNGPFVRLADGSGWLFVKKRHEELIKAVPIIDGKWMLRFKNSVGINLRKQPIDETKSRFEKCYLVDEIVRCDRKIGPSPLGVSFYRVEGTDGWVFDKRNDCIMMELMNHESQSTAINNAVQIGWTPESVRALAATAFVGIQEISMNIESRAISFRHPNGTRINVYYSTRTVGTALEHPLQGRHSFFVATVALKNLPRYSTIQESILAMATNETRSVYENLDLRLLVACQVLYWKTPMKLLMWKKTYVVV